MNDKTSTDEFTTLFQPEMLLPTQFFATLGQKVRAQGEHRLMVAILEDALECFQKHFRATDSRGRQLYADAERWLLSDDTTWLFSCVNICHALGIHPLFLRRGLAQWKARQLTSPGSELHHPRSKSTLRSAGKRGATQTRPLRTAHKT